VSLRDAWDDQAEAWAAWASTPGHDQFFWLHGLPHLLALLPAPGRCTIDLGCGEGRLARELATRGHTVFGVEGSPKLARRARAHDVPANVVNGDAARLPIGDASADLVVASMSLQDIDDLSATVREIARVLVPGGRLCASVVHPINSAGLFADHDPESPFVISGSYLDAHQYVDDIERNDLSMTFHSLHHSLEGYTRALEEAGLLIEALREPAAEDALVASEPAAARWRRLPVFLFVRAVKPGV
jgi:SAM-dependent methyltransferase